jgi:hypothetical protein
VQTALQLVEMGADPHSRSLDGSTPVMDAARNDHYVRPDCLCTHAVLFLDDEQIPLHFVFPSTNSSVDRSIVESLQETVMALVTIMGADVTAQDVVSLLFLHNLSIFAGFQSPFAKWKRTFKSWFPSLPFISPSVCRAHILPLSPFHSLSVLPLEFNILYNI